MDDEQRPPTDLPPAPREDSDPETDVRPSSSHRGRGVAIAAGIVAAIAVIGGVGAFLVLRGSGERLLDKVPADTDMVVSVYLDPSAGQKVNLLRMADEIPSLGSNEGIRGQVDDAIGEALSAAGLTRDDLEWIGPQIAFSVNVPDTGPADDVVVTGLVAAEDEEAAARTLATLRDQDPSTDGWRQEDHDGVEVWVGDGGSEQVAFAVIDGAVVFTNDAASIDDVIAVSRGNADALVDSADFQEATADLPEGKLALFYADPVELSAAIEGLQPTVFDPSAASTSQSFEGITGMALSVSAEEDGLAMDAQVTFDPEELSPATREALTSSDHENPLLEGVPTDALVVVSQGGLRATFEGFIEQVRAVSPDTATAMGSDFVDAMTGDLAITAMPAGDVDMLSGAVMIGTDDEAAMADSIGSFVDELGLSKARWVSTDHGGVAVRTLTARKGTPPYAFSYAVFDGAAVLGASPEAVFEVIDAQVVGFIGHGRRGVRRRDERGAECRRIAVRGYRRARRDDPRPTPTGGGRRVRLDRRRNDGPPRCARRRYGVLGHQHACAYVPARRLTPSGCLRSPSPGATIVGRPGSGAGHEEARRASG